MTNEEVVKKVLVTEKGSLLSVQNRYALEVHPDARKPQIAEAVEKKFGVHVLSVRTMNVKGEKRYVRGTRRTVVTATRKKAIVTVREGERIEAV